MIPGIGWLAGGRVRSINRDISLRFVLIVTLIPVALGFAAYLVPRFLY